MEIIRLNALVPERYALSGRSDIGTILPLPCLFYLQIYIAMDDVRPRVAYLPCRVLFISNFIGPVPPKSPYIQDRPPLLEVLPVPPRMVLWYLNRLHRNLKGAC